MNAVCAGSAGVSLLAMPGATVRGADIAAAGLWPEDILIL